jgi:hypothetical protein
VVIHDEAARGFLRACGHPAAKHTPTA